MFGDNIHGGTPGSLRPELDRGTDRGIDGLDGAAAAAVDDDDDDDEPVRSATADEKHDPKIAKTVVKAQTMKKNRRGTCSWFWRRW